MFVEKFGKIEIFGLIQLIGSTRPKFEVWSRRGAREARPSYFKTKLRPKGPKTNFFWDWAPPLLSQGLDDRPLYPSSLSESLHPPLNFIYVDPNCKLEFGSCHEKFDGCARP